MLSTSEEFYSWLRSQAKRRLLRRNSSDAPSRKERFLHRVTLSRRSDVYLSPMRLRFCGTTAATCLKIKSARSAPLFVSLNKQMQILIGRCVVRKLWEPFNTSARLAECFGNDGLHDFICNLRNALHHCSMIEADWHITQNVGKDTICRFTFEKEELLSGYDSWNVGARHYLDNASRRIDVSLVGKEASAMILQAVCKGGKREKFLANSCHDLVVFALVRAPVGLHSAAKCFEATQITYSSATSPVISPDVEVYLGVLREKKDLHLNIYRSILLRKSVL